MIMKVGAFESPDQGGPSRYPEHMSSTPRKFFTAPLKSLNFAKLNPSRKWMLDEILKFFIF